MRCQNCGKEIDEECLFCPSCGTKQKDNNDDEWYFIFGNEKQGPFSSEKIISEIKKGTINKNTLIWKKGMSDWQSVIQTRFSDVLQTIVPEIPNGMINNKWAWTLATAPFGVCWFLYFFFNDPSVDMDKLSTFVFLIFNLVFFSLDMDTLKRAGKKPNTWLWMGVVLIPVYLFVRAAKTDKKYGYAITWCILCLIDCVIPYLVSE